MSGKEFRLTKELTYSRLTAICAFEPRFLPTSCADHYLKRTHLKLFYKLTTNLLSDLVLNICKVLLI